MLRSAFLKTLEEAQRLGRISAPDARDKIQWYDQLEQTEKFSGPFKIGNALTRFEDKTGLIKLGALGSVGFGGLEALGAVGGAPAAAATPTAAEGAAIAEGMTAAAGVGGTEAAAIGGGMWDWLDTVDIGMGD